MNRRAASREPETVVWSSSAEETEGLGAELARGVAVPGVILLRGALGSGKTTLVRGIARAFGAGEVSSPSFTLINIYQGRVPIYHVDLYRLESAREVESLGLEEFLGLRGLTVVEWSERLTLEPGAALEIDIADAGDDRRRLTVRRRDFRREGGARASNIQTQARRRRP